jgi:uncharacterized delta-60 repeat protein
MTVVNCRERTGAAIRRLALLGLFGALAALLAAGIADAKGPRLDESFGHGGRAVPTYGPAFAAVLPDDLKGPAEAVDSKGRTLKASESASTIERFGPDGTPDESFGCAVEGDSCHSLAYLHIEAILPLPSGKIVVAGSIAGREETTREIALARYEESGVLDPSFGREGVLGLRKERSVAGEELVALTAGAGEDVLVAINDEKGRQDGSPARRGGLVVVAVGGNGQLDPAFGSNGTRASPDFIGAAEGLPGGGLLMSGEHWVGGPLAPHLTTRSSDVFLTRLGAGGVPDQSFGDGGTTVVDLGGLDIATSVLLRDDGSILVGGATTAPRLTCPYPRELFCEETPTLLGFTAAGSLDPGFAQGGVLRLEQLTFDGGLVKAIGIPALRGQPDGSVLAEGATLAARFSARVGADGALDPSFGDGGVLVLARAHESTARVGAISTDASNRILALGGTNAGGIASRFERVAAVFRFRPDGAVDRTFAAGRGYVRVPGHVVGLAAQPGGGAFVLSGKYSNNAVTRVTADGELDPHFGVEGVAPLPERGGVVAGGRRHTIEITPRTIAALPGGGVLVSAWASGFLSLSRIELIRLTRSGALDRSFGHNGVLVIGFGRNGNCTARAMALESDGRIVLGGSIRAGARGSGKDRAAVIRLLPNGQRDPSFGKGGLATAPLPGQALITALGIGSRGEIVAGGRRIRRERYSPLFLRFTPGGHLDRGFTKRAQRTLGPDAEGGSPTQILFPPHRIVFSPNYGPTVLVLATDGRFAEAPSFGKSRRPATYIGGATLQRNKLVVATDTVGRPSFTLRRLLLNR